MPTHLDLKVSIIHDTRHLCTRLATDGIKRCHWYSRGIQVIKFGNASNSGRLCLFSQNEMTVLQSCKMYDLSFDKINVIIACCENTYGRYCIQKSKNDHFRPWFAIIVFNIKSFSFSVVKNKQTRRRFFINCLPPEKPRDIALSHKSIGACKDGGYEKKYAILAISESWLNSSAKNAEVEIDGYSLSRLDRPRNIKNEFGGGVCAYMRKTLKSI